jgi:hypothetical protein
MKILYIDCNMGAAGDMLMSALLELHEDADRFIERLNSVGIPNVNVIKNTSVKCGITGTHIDVTVNGGSEDEHMHEHHHDHSHHHTGMHEIEHIIKRLDLPEKVRGDISAVYRLIADAESRAHGCDIEHIHFHEVGTMDAVADITGVCMLMHELAPDKVVVSPVHVGCGQVRCAHGILPVPAPATAHILKDVPIYGGSIQGELCTPTGAALLKYFADEFGNMPVMRVSGIGYGMGAKDFETANCLRVMLGGSDGDKTEQIFELSCNIDDMTAEEIGFASEQIMKAGAADVFTTPVGMKKNRPGILLSCLCRGENKAEVINAIFKYTSTIGLRQYVCDRYVLDRTESEIETQYGSVRVKCSSGYGAERVKTEYDAAARIAGDCGISIREARALIDKELSDNGYKR